MIKYLMPLMLVFSQAAVAVEMNACQRNLIGEFGLGEIKRSPKLLKEFESRAVMHLDRLAYDDGYPFFVTHYYLREKEHEQKLSIPKNVPLFAVEDLGNHIELKDLRSEQYIGLSITEGSDLSIVSLSDQKNNQIDLRAMLIEGDVTGCYLRYGEEKYEGRYLFYIETDKLKRKSLHQLTDIVNMTMMSDFKPSEIKKNKYFLIDSESTSGMGGEYPFIDIPLVMPVVKLK